MLHYQNKIITAGKDSNEIWRILNDFTGKKCNKYNIKGLYNNGSLIENEKEICDTFNKFFVSVGKDIENKIRSDGIVEKPEIALNNNCNIMDSIFFKPITIIEIEQHINKIKDKTSFVEYRLTNFILKKTANTVSYPLS